MSLITRNEKGAIAINNKAFLKVIIDDMLDMSDDIILCNKKGKPIKSSLNPFTNADYYDSISLQEHKGQTYLKIYLISKFGKSISDVSELLLDKIEEEYELFKLKKPNTISICIKGMMSTQLVKRNIEVTRRNV